MDKEKHIEHFRSCIALRQCFLNGSTNFFKINQALFKGVLKKEFVATIYMIKNIKSLTVKFIGHSGEYEVENSFFSNVAKIFDDLDCFDKKVFYFYNSFHFFTDPNFNCKIKDHQRAYLAIDRIEDLIRSYGSLTEPYLTFIFKIDDKNHIIDIFFDGTMFLNMEEVSYNKAAFFNYKKKFSMQSIALLFSAINPVLRTIELKRN